MLKIGTDPIAAAFAGESRVTGAYVGADLVWRASGGPLYGGIVATSNLGGALRVGRALIAGLSAETVLSGAIGRERALAGAIAGESAFGGDLFVTVDVVLAGGLAAASEAGGSLAVSRAVAGQSASASTLGGTAAIGRGMAGVVDGVSALSGSLRVARGLAGGLSGVSVMDGSLSTTPATVSLLYANGAPGSTSSKTYSGVSFGAADSSRRLLIMIFGGGTARTLTSVTAAGSPVTMFVSNSYFAAGFVDMPTGTSGDIVVTWSGAKASFAIAVYRTTHLRSTTPTDGGFTSFSGLNAGANLYVEAGGIAVGYVYGGGSDSRTVTWSNLTEAFDSYIRTSAADGYAEMHSGASAAFASAQTPILVSATLSGDLADSKTALMWAFR